MKQVLLGLTLVLVLAAPSARTANIEIAASMKSGMWACKSLSDFMQIVVGFTLIHLLVSAAIHPPTTRRQGNAIV